MKEPWSSYRVRLVSSSTLVSVNDLVHAFDVLHQGFFKVCRPQCEPSVLVNVLTVFFYFSLQPEPSLLTASFVLNLRLRHVTGAVIENEAQTPPWIGTCAVLELCQIWLLCCTIIKEWEGFSGIVLWFFRRRSSIAIILNAEVLLFRSSGGSTQRPPGIIILAMDRVEKSRIWPEFKSEPCQSGWTWMEGWEIPGGYWSGRESFGVWPSRLKK